MLSAINSDDVRKLLHNKFVVIIGDSIQRGIYKDLVKFLQGDDLLSAGDLRKKGEECHWNDELIEGGQRGQMTNSKNYREVRQYHTDYHLVRFYIVTRCYGQYMETILADLAQEPRPDVVIMNSCLWDISRYGPYNPAMDAYKKNLQFLCSRMKEVLAEECLFIWNTTLPVGKRIQGGFLIDDIRFLENYLTYLVKEANFYVLQVMETFQVDVMDMHYHFRNPLKQLQWRVKDGIHWNEYAHRIMSKLLYSHICRAWGMPMFERHRGKSGVIEQITVPLPSAPAPARRHQRSTTSDAVLMHGNGNQYHNNNQFSNYHRKQQQQQQQQQQQNLFQPMMFLNQVSTLIQQTQQIQDLNNNRFGEQNANLMWKQYQGNDLQGVDRYNRRGGNGKPY